MGIPQLTRTLEPLAARAELNGEVVIDGPGLAYHIFNLSRRGSRRPIGPLDEPSYGYLARRALRWLDALQSYNITVSAIYFDGHLPESKRGERMVRLYEGSKILNNYYTSTLGGIPASVVTGSDEALKERTPRPATRQLPLPSFIVPTLLDALRGSERYAAVTHVVPGEADPFCADHVRRCGGTVLTSDSDLLLYDLGEKGSVVFFKDLEIQEPAQAPPSQGPREDTSKKSVVQTYTKAQMCDKLSLPADRGLYSLAFEIMMDPHPTLPILVEKSLKHEAANAFPEDYERFLAPYVTSPDKVDSRPGLTSLDPRVSEFIIQTLPAKPSSGEPDEEVAVFLPLLLDSWDRSSAWEPSTRIRQLAYGISQLPPSSKKLESMTEHRRTQSKMSKGRQVEVPQSADLRDASETILDAIKKCRGTEEPEMGWILLSMAQEIMHSADQTKESLVVKLWRQAGRSRGKLEPTSWDVVHLAAQLQGSFYSLRTLQQVLGFLEQEDDAAMPAYLAELQGRLSSLPPISGFPTIRAAAAVFERLKQAGRLALLAEAAGLPEPIPLDGGVKERKKKDKNKRKRDGGAGSEETRARKPKSTAGMWNPFDVLADA